MKFPHLWADTIKSRSFLISELFQLSQEIPSYLFGLLWLGHDIPISLFESWCMLCCKMQQYVTSALKCFDLIKPSHYFCLNCTKSVTTFRYLSPCELVKYSWHSLTSVWTDTGESREFPSLCFPCYLLIESRQIPRWVWVRKKHLFGLDLRDVAGLCHELCHVSLFRTLN